jgi:hypothetical protein
MAVQTQGTQLYYFDDETSAWVEVDCITSFTGLSAPKDQVDVTCLADQARRFMNGLATPGAANFEINSDPATDSGHLQLFEIYNDNDVLHWAIGWADGMNIAPTDYDSQGPVLPTTRTWLYLDGSITDFPFNFDQNSVVKSPLAIQVSGQTFWIPKAGI